MSKYSIEEVFSFIEKNKSGDKYHLFDGKMVSVKSPRYDLFMQKGTKCVACGLQATHFCVDEGGNEKHHFNLYAEVDGKVILFTKDHIIARSNGGKNHISNYQTMCEICNTLKGSNDNKIFLESVNDKEKEYMLRRNLSLGYVVKNKIPIDLFDVEHKFKKTIAFVCKSDYNFLNLQKDTLRKIILKLGKEKFLANYEVVGLSGAKRIIAEF